MSRRPMTRMAIPATDRLEQVQEWLRAHADPMVRAGLARFGIPSDHAFGIKVDRLRAYARQLGRDQELSERLWQLGVHEARLLAVFVAEVDAMTVRRMDAWCRDFDNWAICDTACFDLFDRSPLAFGRVDVWMQRQGEFQKRAAFALLAGLALHNKRADPEQFRARLPALEAAAVDPRHYVKKGLSWALRGIGKRDPALAVDVLAICARLAKHQATSARWLARDVARELEQPKIARVTRPPAPAKRPRL